MSATASKTSTTLIERIQEQLRSESIDGWLFYYFKNNDPIALSILGMTEGHMTRRWFYYVPAKGEPVKLVHGIELDVLDALPGTKEVYVGWKQLEQKLGDILTDAKSIAMQYSPKNAVPYVSRVDAGTIELIRSLGKNVVTSGNLVQAFEASWSEAQLQTHIYAVESLRKIVFEAFAEVKRLINKGEAVNEYDIQQFIMGRFDHYEMTTYSPPIVAVNGHSGLPHYQPSKEEHAPIKKGDFLLLDIWAKRRDVRDAIYGDITWTGYVGTEVPTEFVKIFDIVKGARDAALDHVKDAVAKGEVLHGWQVDEVARTYIRERGYADYFIHRTGHSIGTEVHGNGANLDNLETKDERVLIYKHGFSIEPGVYLKEFGVRSEIDVYIEEGKTLVAGGPIQEKIIPILAD
ncbi:M24 family metallopeptidase [Candidatus Obscuribacterales bacterium]|nr:M24 family metallopeptidase [Candidatus Obscuribacterales bacterium]MBX3149120.1 M24 family metallopeptidase [Candidatus Obscuribacterales bacterium]